MNVKNFLITGPPRCGKSTFIESIISRIDKPMTGFFTREIRKDDRRTGFRIITLDGKSGLFADEKIKSRFRVGKYGVDLGCLNSLGVPSIVPSNASEIVVIDEIGKMECYSELFRTTLIATWDSPNKVIASVALKGNCFIEEIKRR